MAAEPTNIPRRLAPLIMSGIGLASPCIDSTPMSAISPPKPTAWMDCAKAAEFAGGPDLDHVLDGATGKLGRLGAPLRLGLVIERGVGAELPRARELRVARGSRHDPRAGGLGDPQREERHATGSDQQHPLAAL